MLNNIKKLISQLSESLKKIPPGRKFIIFFTSALVTGGFIFLVFWAQKTEYSLLFSNLSPEDTSAIIEKLKSQKISYQLNNNGTAIMVSSDKVYELRLQLAGGGLPQSSGVGFELFDSSTFGMTEFVQKLNYMRALQGELSRTIMQLKEVEKARVHIVMPEKALFKEDQNKTTASVAISLKTGKNLDSSQIQGVVHLIASAVEGLDPSNVTVVDVHGKILSGGGGSSTISKLTGSQLEYKESYQQDISKRVQSMIENVIGQGKAIVRVTADLNFLQEERTEETFDPDSQVARSEQLSEDSTEGASTVSGVPGVQSNIPGGEPKTESSNKGAKSSRKNETRNYELNKITRKIIEPVGQLTKLSVAVIIDGIYTPGKEGKPEFKARSVEEMKKYEALVKSAIGFNAVRGDIVEVTNMPFDSVDTWEERKMMNTEADRLFWLEVIKYVLSGIGLIIGFFMVLRPLIQWVMGLERDFVNLKTPISVADLEKELGVEVTEGAEAKKTDDKTFHGRVLEAVRNNPEGAASMIRKWIKEGAAASS